MSDNKAIRLWKELLEARDGLGASDMAVYSAEQTRAAHRNKVAALGSKLDEHIRELAQEQGIPEGTPFNPTAGIFLLPHEPSPEVET